MWFDTVLGDLAAVVAIISFVASIFTWVFRRKKRKLIAQKEQEKADLVAEYKSLTDAQQRQIESQERQIASLQAEIQGERKTGYQQRKELAVAMERREMSIRAKEDS